MKNNKSPGPDGIIIEFYKVYWEYIKNDLKELYDDCLDTEELSYTQYLALIILLYKKGPREMIKNWRPISLMNNDTKIISKVLALRVKKVLPDIIHTDQKGCIEGRFIGQNIRLVQDIINEMDDDNIILLLDQQKAFDRVEWGWLFQVLKTFNFGDNFINWIKILYKNMKSAVFTNGYVSEYFSISRGIRQGDSLSALLYIIQAEPLASFIRQSNEIKGVELIDHDSSMKNEVKICQYVDDSSTILHNSNNISACYDIIDDFGKASGSKLNKIKTVCISKKRDTTVNHDLNISNGNEILLGVPVGTNDDYTLYWANKIAKMKNSLQQWEHYNLSLIGKIYLIKSMAMSVIAYPLEMIDIDDYHLNEIDAVWWDFLWNGKKNLIKRDICKLPINKGGLGYPDIQILYKVKRIKMLLSVMKENDSWNLIARKYLGFLDKKYNMKWFALCIDDSTDEILNSNIPKFYKACLLSYQELCRKARRFGWFNSILWCNDRFRSNGETLKFFHWAKSNIQCVDDIFENGQFCKEKILQKLKKPAGFIFEYRKIINALKGMCYDDIMTIKTSHFDFHINDLLNAEFILPYNRIKKLSDLSSSDIYDTLLLDENIHLRSIPYWREKFNGEQIDFDALIQCMLCSKLIPRKVFDFNWRIFHGLVNNEKRLKAMGFSNGLCVFCQIEEENTEHIFLCKTVHPIWVFIKRVLTGIIDKDVFVLTKFNIIFGFVNNDAISDVMNMILGVARWEIWKRRCKFKYDNTMITSNMLMNIVKYKLEMHVDTLLYTQTKTIKTEHLEKLKLLLSK